MVQRFRAILHGQRPTFRWAHSDLWYKIFAQVVAKGASSFRIHKVKAHDLASGRSRQPTSWSDANDIVDYHAKVANLERPQDILD